MKELLRTSNTEKILLHPNALITGLLYSVWTNDVNILKLLLNNRADPQTADNYGR